MKSQMNFKTALTVMAVNRKVNKRITELSTLLDNLIGEQKKRLADIDHILEHMQDPEDCKTCGGRS